MADFDKDKPAGATKLRLSDDDIRTNNYALEEAIGRDHKFPTGDGTDSGEHLQITFNAVLGADVDPGTGKFAVYPKDNAAGDPDLFCQDENDTVLKIFYGEGGTEMLFIGNSAPTGWTRNTSRQDNAMLCYAATGNPGSGGSVNPQSTHTHGAGTHTHTFTGGGHTHTGPSHTHGLGSHTHSFSSFHTHGLNSHTHSFSDSHTHGLNSHTHTMGTHNHKWYNHTGAGSHDRSYNSAGTATNITTVTQNGTALRAATNAEQPAIDMYTTKVDPGDTGAAAGNTAAGTASGTTGAAAGSTAAGTASGTTGAAAGNTGSGGTGATGSGQATGTTDASGGDTAANTAPYYQECISCTRDT